MEFFALFTDEAAFIYWPIFFALLWKKFDRKTLVTYLAMPGVYVFFAKIVLPPVYNLLGRTGARSGVIDYDVIIKLIKNIFGLEFWGYALEDFSASISASFGTLAAPMAPTLFLMLGVIIYSLVKKNYPLLRVSAVIIISSIFFSWLDMINTSRNYMGQWTYYYHSPLAVLSVLLSALVFDSIKKDSKFSQFFLILICFISLSNIYNFYRVNEILKTLHLYPIYSVYPLSFDENKMAKEYEGLIANPALPQSEGLRKQFEYYKKNPMGTEDYAKRLNRTYEK